MTFEPKKLTRNPENYPLTPLTQPLAVVVQTQVANANPDFYCNSSNLPNLNIDATNDLKRSLKFLCRTPIEGSSTSYTGSTADVSAKLLFAAPHEEEFKNAFKNPLNSQNPRVRISAAYTLWKLKPNVAKQAFKAELTNRSTDWTARGTAIEILEKLGGPDARAIIEIALEDTEGSVRIQAIRALAELGDSAALPALRAVARRDPEHWIRILAAEEGLGKFGDPYALQVLETKLQDSNSSIRGDAASALGRLGNRAARPALEEALKDSSMWVKSRAARSLRELGDPAALPPLKEAFKHLDPKSQLEIALALATLGDFTTARPVLEAVLKGSPKEGGRYVASILAKSGNPAGLLVLEKDLEENRWPVSYWAVDNLIALAKVGNIRATKALEEAVQKNLLDDLRRNEINNALRKLRKP